MRFGRARQVNGARVLAAALGLLLAVALTACGGSDGGPTPAPELPEGGPLPEALQGIVAEVVAQRGLAAPDELHAGLVGRDDGVRLVEASLTDDDRRWFANTTTLYRLLGYLGPEDDYLARYLGFARAAVAGFYIPATRTIWLISEDPGRGWDALTQQEKATLAHEIVHALQDHAFDLEAGTRTRMDDLDRYLAWQAVVEGDAVVQERLFAQEGRRLPVGGSVVLFARATQSPGGLPAPVDRVLRFPYTTGPQWVGFIMGHGGVDAVDAALRDPPAATTVLLHQGAYARDWQPEPVERPDGRSALGEGWTVESSGTFGEFHLLNLLLTRLRALDAAKGAAGWAGDHYAVFRHDDGRAAGLFRFRFSDATQADEALAALRELLGGETGRLRSSFASVARTGERDVVLAITMGGVDSARAVASMTGG